MVIKNNNDLKFVTLTCHKTLICEGKKHVFRIVLLLKRVECDLFWFGLQGPDVSSASHFDCQLHPRVCS